MSDDWEDLVIETGVDTLLNYISEEKEATVSEISEDLGVSEERIKDWADALESNNFIEKEYSARHGMVLKHTEENQRETDKKAKQLKEEVKETTEEVEEKMKNRHQEVGSAKERLKKMKEELEENQERERELKDQIEELEELENELEEDLENYRKEEKIVHSRSMKLLSQIDSALDRIEDAEEEAEIFEEKKNQIEKKVKALKKLEYSKNDERVNKKLNNIERDEEEAESLFKSFKSKVKRVFHSDSGSVLDGNVDEVRDRISEMENLNYKRLLEEEKNGQDRKTVKEYLKRQIDG